MIMDCARDPKKTSEQLDAEVNRTLHNVTQDRGKWFDLGGFFASEDEILEIQDALEIAKGIDPVIENSLPAWQQRKEQLLRLAREFRSTYV